MQGSERDLQEREKILRFQIRDFELRKKRFFAFLEERRKMIPIPEAQAATMIQRSWRAHRFRQAWARFSATGELRVATEALFRSEQLFLKEMSQLSGIRSLSGSSQADSVPLFHLLATLIDTSQGFLELFYTFRYPSEGAYIAYSSFLCRELLPLLLVYSTMLPEALLNYNTLRKHLKKGRTKLSDEALKHLLLAPILHLKTYEAHFRVLVTFPEATSFSTCLEFVRNIQASS